MNVGVLSIEIHISDSGSLKEKRKYLNSIKTRIRNKYNVSVAEVDYMDKWQKSLLAMSLVSNDKKFISHSFDNIIDFVETYRKVDVIDYNIEVF